ncbi:MAG: presenilin family intramembrane aspartyl protease [archaeon]
MNKNLLLQLVALFLVTQILGLYVGLNLVSSGIQREGIVNDNPDDPINSVGLFGYILVSTAILLIVLKFYKGDLLFIFVESLLVFLTSLIVFGFVLPEELGLIALALAVLLVATRLIFRKNVLLRNIASVIAAAGAGPLIGYNFGLIPVMLFLIILAGYDIIAVFYTKHMVVLAKSITKKNLAFTFALPTKEHNFELGTGDMVIPLVFAVSVLTETSKYFVFPFNLVSPAIILWGSLVGLGLTVHYSSKNVGNALPALPLQTIIMFLMLGLCYALGVLV